jgi:membrane-bound lytic murein transglycosylase D
MQAKWSGVTGLLLLSTIIVLATFGWKSREVLPAKEPAENTGTNSLMPIYRTPPIPETIEFVGMSVPVNRFEIRESLEREILVNAYFHSQTIRFIKLAPRFFSIIDPILLEEGVPADFRYLAVAESGLNPKAVSPAGATGFWQLMKPAAADYGLEVNTEVDERYHIEKSTRAACRYLKDSFLKYGDWALVAASYNAGRSSVDRQLARQKADNYFDLLMSEETERYVYRILAIKLIMEDPGKYGFQITEDEKYPLWNTKKVEIKGTVADFADYAASHGTTYKTLKYYNPWLRDNKLTNKTGKTYVVELPAE